jgi:uncharacterized protein (TIRG00374 family)
MTREQIGRLANFTIGFGLAAVLLWFFLKDADWTQVGVSISHANVLLLLAALTGHVISLLIRTWRWRLLLWPVKAGIPYAPVWRYLNIGFAVISLLPGRVGELLRPYLLARDQEISFTSTFATVVTERVVDLLMVLALLSTFFVFPEVLGPRAADPDISLLIGTIKGFGLLALIVAVVAMIFLSLLKLKTDWALKTIAFLARPFPRRISDFLTRTVQAFADGLGGLRGLGQVGGLIGSTVLNWLVVTTSFWLALLGFGFGAVPFHHTFFLLAVVALGVVVPTPAGTGTYHAAVIVVAGSLWGLPYNQVVSYAIVNHLITFAPSVIFGVYYLSKGHINVFSLAGVAAENRIKGAGTE